MVAASGPKDRLLAAAGTGGAPSGPAVLPGCPTASPGPATLGSLKPGNEDAG